jgi:hypothetical protein
MRTKGLILIFYILLTISASGQKAMTLSQYMHNRFAINSAFAGSREVLSVFGSFRKQWAGPSHPSPSISQDTLH